jgi:hypothetical protein
VDLSSGCRSGRGHGLRAHSAQVIRRPGAARAAACAHGSPAARDPQRGGADRQCHQEDDGKHAVEATRRCRAGRALAPPDTEPAGAAQRTGGSPPGGLPAALRRRPADSDAGPSPQHLERRHRTVWARRARRRRPRHQRESRLHPRDPRRHVTDRSGHRGGGLRRLVRHECEFPDGRSFTFLRRGRGGGYSDAHTLLPSGGQRLSLRCRRKPRTRPRGSLLVRRYGVQLSPGLDMGNVRKPGT